MKTIRITTSLILTCALLFRCVEEPVKEDVPELITKVTLEFTPTTGSETVEATALDPDGEGIQNITTDGPIVLKTGQSYTLSISLINELADATSPEYNITDEVEEEGDEHMIFFEWTDEAFVAPAGNGNADHRSDEVDYQDEDSSHLPIGLKTFWTAVSSPSSGAFRIILKHQPNLKSATSGANVGETDLDVTFDLKIR